MTTPTIVDADTTEYQKYRGLIKDGDILCFSGRHWLSAWIRKLSHGRYSHAALAFWWGPRLMVLQAEARPGVEALPASRAISQYPGSVDWYPLRTEHRSKAFEDAIAAIAMDRLGDGFSIFDLIGIGLHYWIGTKLPEESRTNHKFVCAQYVAYCYSQVGLDLKPNRPDIGTTPQDVANSGYHGAPVRLKT